MIEFQNVTFGYGNRKILDDVSFTVGYDERMAILGGSGEGKTTILRLILGLLKADAGRVSIDGEDITPLKERELAHVRQKFSIVFQEGALFDSLDVRENVAFCLREGGVRSEQEIERHVREVLRLVGVEHAIDMMPAELSGGMHRRVAIARSMAAISPRMFLYDEATTGLDPINAANICDLINKLCERGAGMILVTHRVIDALRVARRFMFLSEARVLLDDDRDALLGSRHPTVKTYVDELCFDPLVERARR